MYSVRHLREAIGRPKQALIELNRLYHRRLYQHSYNENGINIFEEDWDTLVILDACRYDMFAERSSLPGDLRRVESRGSSTREFLHGNFAGRDLRDTVYVTGNPQLYEYADEIDVTFHDEVHIWQDDGWDEELGTVSPETTTEYALDAAANYPNKRLIVHYLQPHYPFTGSDTTFDKGHLMNSDSDAPDFWNQLTDGTMQVPEDTVWGAYLDNLESVLPFVQDLMEELNGKTVVTSDHGNMINERAFPIPIRIWGHPRGIHTRSLVDVPWHVYENGPRREIIAEDPPREREDVDEAVVRDRLSDLGYVE